MVASRTSADPSNAGLLAPFGAIVPVKTETFFKKLPLEIAWKTLAVIFGTDTNFWNDRRTFPDKTEDLANAWPSQTKIHTNLFHLSFQGGQNGCIIIITAIILITQTRTRNISMFQHSRFDSLQLGCHGFSEGGSPPASLLTVKGCRDSADAVLSGSGVQDALCCGRQRRAGCSGDVATGWCPQHLGSLI